MLVVERSETGGVLRLLAPDGALPIEIAVSRDGAVLRLGRGLALAIDGPLALDVDSLAVRARRGITLASGGRLGLRAEGDIVSSGESQTIAARRGNVDIAANDDVALRGERVKVNC